MTDSPHDSDGSDPSTYIISSFAETQTSLLPPSVELNPITCTNGRSALHFKLQRICKPSSFSTRSSIGTLYGVGSVYGNLIQMVGKHIIGMFVRSEIIYRLWLIRQLHRILERDQTKRIENVLRGIAPSPPNEYDRRAESYHEAVKDILELSKCVCFTFAALRWKCH